MEQALENEYKKYLLNLTDEQDRRDVTAKALME